MSLGIHLLGKPWLERDGEVVTPPRGNKAWALLAYLILSRAREPSREHVSELLFAEADDPLGSVRWNLAELRRRLGSDALPPGRTRLTLAPDAFVDVQALLTASPHEAVELPGLGCELLEGLDFGRHPGFDTWLLNERRHLLGAAEGALHEAALDLLAAGEPTRAVPVALRLVELNDLDENFQELLIRSYAEAGDAEAADNQLARFTALFRSAVGRDPARSVLEAARTTVMPLDPMIRAGAPHAARAQLETGQSALDAGAIDAGLETLSRAAAAAAASGDGELESEARLAYGTALLHSGRSRDEEAGAVLLRGAALAEELELGDRAAAFHRELAYMEVRQARYARCGRRLDAAATHVESDAERAGLEAIRGMAAADTGAHRSAVDHLRRSTELAEASGSGRQASFSLSFLGRSHLLCGELTDARAALERSLSLVREEDWLSFLPWPEAWLAGVALAEGDPDKAQRGLEHSFALGCELNDPCWEGLSARGLGLLACRDGRTAHGLRMLEDARRRSARIPCAYVWVQAYALAALAEAAVEADNSRADEWIGDLASIAGRTGMREFAVKAALLRVERGDRAAAEAAVILAREVENPGLDARLGAPRAAA